MSNLRIEEAAEHLKVSPNSVKRAKKLLDRGDSELIARVQSNELSVSAASRHSLADMFGRWVPAEWNEAILDVFRACPEWVFIKRRPGVISRCPVQRARSGAFRAFN